MAHICGEKAGANRYDASQSDKQRDENLKKYYCVTNFGVDSRWLVASHSRDIVAMLVRCRR